MRVRCKLCGEILEDETEALPLNIVAGDESTLKLAEMSNHLLLVINHLLLKHPEKSLELYSEINQKFGEMFEVMRDEE